MTHRTHYGAAGGALALSLTLAAGACNNNGASSGNNATSSGNNAAIDASASNGAAVETVVDAASARADASAEGGTDFRGASNEQSAEFRRLFSQATTAFGRNDFTEAARVFRQLYDQSPSVDTAYNLARVYERIGESIDAITFFQRVLQGDPPPSDGQRADIDARIARLRAYEARRAAGIAAAPATSDELNQEGVAWFNRGVRFFQRNQFSSALQAFEQASRYLQSAELDFNLGMTYERLRNYPRALEYLRQYLETIRGQPEEIPIQRRIREIEQRQ
jgi:tetratricopeptide (TPR) repeat protein